MSQQGSDNHIFKALGRDLDARRLIENDPEAVTWLRKLKAKGYSSAAVRDAMDRLIEPLVGEDRE